MLIFVAFVTSAYGADMDKLKRDLASVTTTKLEAHPERRPKSAGKAIHLLFRFTVLLAPSEPLLMLVVVIGEI
jgi:hypothetical protein